MQTRVLNMENALGRLIRDLEDQVSGAIHRELMCQDEEHVHLTTNNHMKHFRKIGSAVSRRIECPTTTDDPSRSPHGSR